MKVLVISDTHLGRFSKKRFEFLKRTIEAHDTVILNGDFYEGFVYDFEQFVKSKWSLLFPYLKEKNTVYIFGNHDNDIWVKDKSLFNLFSDSQTHEHIFTLGNITYNIQHGHNLNPFLDTQFNIKPPKLIAECAIWLDTQLGNIFGRSIYYAIAKLFNKKIKFLIQNMQTNYTYIVGHTHWGEIDIKNKFINSGVNKHNFGQFVTLTEDSITLTSCPKFGFKQYSKVVNAEVAINHSLDYRNA